MKPWSEQEDAMLLRYYARHGPKWVGWRELLPSRTQKAISGRAQRIGCASFGSGNVDYDGQPKGEAKGFAQSDYLVPDPYEGYVMECMQRGMTPKQIDRERRWMCGTARMIISNRWKREKEQGTS